MSPYREPKEPLCISNMILHVADIMNISLEHLCIMDETVPNVFLFSQINRNNHDYDKRHAGDMRTSSEGNIFRVTGPL